MAKSTFKTDIRLGERYRDNQTGIEGVATAIYFFQYACERVMLESVHPQRGLQEHTFDSPRLTHIDTNQQATSKRPGGPALERNVKPGGNVR